MKSGKKQQPHTKIAAKQVIGVFLSICMLCGSLAVIVLVAASNSEEETDKWLIDFGVIFAQDFVLIPLMMIPLQLIAFKIASSKKKTG